MTTKNISIQVSIFGDFNDISATPECTFKLLNLFKDFGFIPSTFHELNPVNMMAPNVRPMLSTVKNEWNIRIASSRIDILRQLIDEKDTDISNVFECIKTAFEYIAIIVKEFNKKPNRIALNSTTLVFDIDRSELDRIYGLLVNPLDYYKENKPCDWGINLNTRVETLLNGGSEIINVITNINSGHGELLLNNQIKKTEGITIAFDINTIPENKNQRFDENSIKEFLDKALESRRRIINSLEGTIHVE